MGVIPTEPVVALSGRRHARRALAKPRWSSVIDVARAIVRDVLFTCSVLLALVCAAAGGLFGALAIAFIRGDEPAHACLSIGAALLSVLACKPALHLDARRAARARDSRC